MECNTSGTDCITVGTGQGDNTLYLEPEDTTIDHGQIIPISTFTRTANGTSIAIHDQSQALKLANHILDGVGKQDYRLLGVSGGPGSWGELRDTPDGCVSQARQHSSWIVAHRKFEPAAAFDHR